MAWVCADPEKYAGRVLDTGHCVRYVQIAANMPHTSQWRRGAKVRGNDVPQGTIIATFDPNGRYGNHTDGRSHAAVFDAEVTTGLVVWDCWRGQPVHKRTIRWGQPKPVNNGDAFYVVEEELPPLAD